MTPEEMLKELSEHGQGAFADYNDGLDGWFGWGIKDSTLTVTWQATDSDGRGVAPAQMQWALTEKDEAKEALS